MKAVRFDHYGGPDVLEVREVERPTPAAGEVLVQIRAASINPGEIAIREGFLHERWPATFPSGEGTDLAGVVAELGPGAEGFETGDEVVGWSEMRSSHAEFAAVPATQLTAKPSDMSWEVAGSLFVAPLAAYACVQATAPRAGEIVAVSGAAGGVGSVAVQLARLTGATVIGLASEPNHAWLERASLHPTTSSPASKPSTSEPTSATTPARSVPSPLGNVAGQRSCRKPSRIAISPGLIEAALISTSTSAAAGTGRSTSRTSSTSVPP